MCEHTGTRDRTDEIIKRNDVHESDSVFHFISHMCDYYFNAELIYEARSIHSNDKKQS